MKYKRISTKDYLVNEDQFIELLENKALEGWYLKNISLNFLTFEKRTPQRKHYKIYYKQSQVRLEQYLPFILIIGCFNDKIYQIKSEW